MSARTLKLTSPAMRGSDVERFQKDLNAELGRWHISYRLAEDGFYGVKTRDMAQSVCYGLGLKSPVMEHGATPAIRTKVRHRKLTPAELVRFKDRRDWRERFARRMDGPDVAVRAALSFAMSMLGIKEQPPNSNTGPKIDGWQAACGVHAAPWCGCFVNACLKAGGFPDQEWLRYCPAIEGKAKAGDGGWSWHTKPERGDLALYGLSIAQHVGIVEEVDDALNWGDTATIEGNTTGGPGGPQADGGMVARRHRHKDGSLAGFPIRGYARAPWASL